MAAPELARRGRSWSQRLLIGLNIFIVLALIGAGSGYAYFRWRISQINKVSIPSLQDDESGGQVMNVLLVGSDSRARLTGADAVQAGKGKVDGERSDTIMVLHIDPNQQKAAILSLPRDLLVSIPGTGRMDRINTAITTGGPSRLIATIRQNLGIRINHYVEVDFVGFKSIVEAVGGVDVYIPAPARDALAGLALKKAGCIKLNGGQALSWARSRHYEYFESGRWREDPRGDLGRIQRQQELIRRMMKSAVDSGRYNPIQLNRLIGIGIRNLTIDSAMSNKDILSLGRRFKSLNPDAVEMLTLPVTDAEARLGGQTASVLKVQQPEAQEFVDRLNGRASTPSAAGPSADLLKPHDVRVRVLNGTGSDSLAGKVAGDLTAAGFTVADKGDADVFRYERSIIRYDRGQLAKAQVLQRYLAGGVQLQERQGLKTVDAELVVGTAYAGVRPPGAVGGAPTSTIPSPSPTPSTKGAPVQASC